MKISVLIIAAIFFTLTLEACVTYDRSSATYTVDKQGCVEQKKRDHK